MIEIKSGHLNPWWKTWLCLGAALGAVEVIFNCPFGRFPIYFFRSGNPLLVIPAGAAFEIGVWCALSLGGGVIVEIIRRFFRGAFSWHIGAQVTGALLLEAWVVRMLLGIGMRNGLFRSYPPPNFSDGGVFLGIAVAAALVGIWLALSLRRAGAEVIEGIQRRIVLFVMGVAAAYALVFNRWISTTAIPLPRASGVIGAVVMGAFLVEWIAHRRKWNASRLIRVVLFLALLATVGLMLFFSWPGGGEKPNIIVSLWDTARSSRMSLYGYEEPTTPGLESLSSRALVFESAWAPSNYTYPSHVSLFLGKSYRAHNYHIGGGKEVARYRNEFTLADRLKALGYHPVLFTENSWVLAADKGFEEVRFFPVQSNYFDAARRECEVGAWPPLRKYAGGFLGRMAVDAFSYWLDRDYPFTLYRVQLRYLQELLIRSRRTGPIFLFWNTMTVHDRCYPISSRPPSTIIKDYDFAREYTLSLLPADEQFMNIYRLVERCGQLDKTIFIVTSDHGEFLGEENLYGHHKALFEPVLRVPLAIIHRNLKPDRVTEPVSLNFFYRMIEDLAQSSGPPSARAIKDIMTRGKPVVSEHGYLPEEWSREYKWCYAVMADKFHYIFDPRIDSYHSSWPAQPTHFLYQLGKRESPKNNLVKKEPARATRLGGIYSKYLQELPEKISRADKGAHHDKDAKLRALGYLR